MIMFNKKGWLLALALMILPEPGLVPARAAPGDAKAASDVQTEPTRTSKERLSNKASDEQRVDNCKVPIEQRGPKPRPDTCGENASLESRR
jgi:hypothetical protein